MPTRHDLNGIALGIALVVLPIIVLQLRAPAKPTQAPNDSLYNLISQIAQQLRESTYNEVKAALPPGAKISFDSQNEPVTGGPGFVSDGKGYGVEGLHSIYYGFDEQKRLIRVLWFIKGERYVDVKQHLDTVFKPVNFGRYLTITSETMTHYSGDGPPYTNGDLLYEGYKTVVKVTQPRSNTTNFSVEYMTPAFFVKSDKERSKYEAQVWRDRKEREWQREWAEKWSR